MSARLFKGTAENTFASFVIPAAATLPVPAWPVTTVSSPPAPSSLASDSIAEPEADATDAEYEAAEQLRAAAEESLRIVEAARAEAAKLIAQAQAQTADLERDARERGLADARSAFEAELSHAVADLREQLTATIAEIAGLRGVIAAQAEHDLVRLALEIARKIIRREVSADPDIVITLARIALERLPSRVGAKVRISPEEFEYVTANSQALSADNAIDLVADFAIKRGGCIVESEAGSIDARIEEQLHLVERGLLHE